MTTEQHALLSAANLQLRLEALRYAVIMREAKDTTDAEHRLAIAAKAFVRTVDAIDPAMWEPTSLDVQ